MAPSSVPARSRPGTISAPGTIFLCRGRDDADGQHRSRGRAGCRRRHRACAARFRAFHAHGFVLGPHLEIAPRFGRRDELESQRGLVLRQRQRAAEHQHDGGTDLATMQQGRARRVHGELDFEMDNVGTGDSAGARGLPATAVHGLPEIRWHPGLQDMRPIGPPDGHKRHDPDG